MSRRRPITGWVSLALLMAACEPTPAKLGADPVDPDASVMPDGVRGIPAELLGLPNIDDDDGNGVLDWKDRASHADNDIIGLVIQTASVGSTVTALQLSLTADQPLRLWQGSNLLLEVDGDTTTVDWQPDLIVLGVEFRGFLQRGQLRVQAMRDDAPVGEAVVVELLSAPMLLNHHLQPAEEVFAVDVRGGFGGNAGFIQGFEDALGPMFTAARGDDYGEDVWMQDEFEFTRSRLPDGTELDLVIDSIRDRGLNGFVQDELLGPNVGGATWGRGQRPSSQDSFGNLEASPPVVVDGVDYPFGRIYYGAAAERYGPTNILTDELYAQAVQAPFEIDTRWLCVGHVDEISSFVPDSTAPKGFRFVYADVDAGYALLESLDPSSALPKYAGNFNGHGIATVGEMVEDAALRAYNEDVRDLHLLPGLERFKAALGLDEQDMIRMPSLFEAACGQQAAALIPGMVNLQSVTVEGGGTHVFMADPFMRDALTDQAADPFIGWVREHLPEELELHFIDDWSTYHLALGEVHCGSNVIRTPTDTWWTAAGALIGREE